MGPIIGFGDIQSNILRLRSAQSSEENKSNPAYEAAFIRLRFLTERIHYFLEHTDISIITESELLKADAEIASMADAIERFKNDQMLDRIHAISNRITELMQMFSYAVMYNEISTTDVLLSNIEKRATRSLSDINIHLKNVESQHEKFEKKLSNLTASVEQVQSEADKLNISISEIMTNWQKSFLDAQEQRDSQFSNNRERLVTEIQARFEELHEQTKLHCDNLKAITEKNYDTLFSQSQEEHNKILALSQLVAEDSVSANYLQAVNNQRKSADFWRNSSIAFLMLAIVWLIFVYCNTSLEEVQFPSYFSKVIPSVVVTAILLWAAGYSAQQSTRHRSNEDEARHFALQMKSIDPFISSLSDLERLNIKKRIAEDFFRPKNPVSPSSSEYLSEHMLSLIGRLVKDIAAAIKK